MTFFAVVRPSPALDRALLEQVSMDSGPAALPPCTARLSRPAPVLPWADSACADPEFACTRAERRTLPMASRRSLPSNGSTRLLGLAAPGRFSIEAILVVTQGWQ